MHLLEISLLLANLICTNLATDFSHSDYYEYYEQEQTYEADSPPKSDMEQKLRSASSVDELMTLIYPSYWAALKCTSKLSTAVASTASKVSQHPQPHLLRPLADPEESTFAAAYLNLDVLKSIESEWRKTQCMPKEVCVDVGREFGAPTNIFYKPPCVSVYRCGGCCHSEDKQCKNISTGYLSKTLFEITVPITQGTKPVTISVANHTQCSCLSKLDIYKQVHSIIRRSLSECPIDNRTCPPGQMWSSSQCRCVNTAPDMQVNTPPLPLPPPRPSQHHLALTCQDMDSTRPLKVCCGIWHQDVSRSFEACKLRGVASMKWTCLSSTSHRCSIGLRFGEFGGQVNTSNFLLCSSNHSKPFLLCGTMHYPA
ncbi:vascular endothelial growth factor C isoform X3 [Acanthochromis polyacanthus]|uniref:vascular endothelial growth factor C isoform X3 n=1 Tax=Acanthochromis polyacanthus TaxID=80966 RepID=UPI00223415CD|nr:vascular endothelial growth factor C isoform X3 [Acanthochromis polyacanthus]